MGGADILVRMCVHLKNYYKTRHVKHLICFIIKFYKDNFANN